MNKHTYQIGDLATVYFGKIPMIGTVVYINGKDNTYLVRFNAGQQMYYTADELQAYVAPGTKK